MTALIGSDRQSILVTSPARLASIDSPRFVGALRYFTSRPTSSENGRQMTGNIHGFAVTKSFCHSRSVTAVYTVSQASTDTAPITATITTWTYGCTGRTTVTASLTSGSSTPATDDRDAPPLSPCASPTWTSLRVGPDGSTSRGIVPSAGARRRAGVRQSVGVRVASKEPS